MADSEPEALALKAMHSLFEHSLDGVCAILFLRDAKPPTDAEQERLSLGAKQKLALEVYQEIVNNIPTYSHEQLQTAQHLGELITNEVEVATKRADTATARAIRLEIAGAGGGGGRGRG